jgi:hypothetical protein
MTTAGPKIDCAGCQHYRPQVSFVDFHKDSLDQRSELYDAMNESRKEETEILEGELEMLMEQCRVEDPTWPASPRFAPMCAAVGGPFVAALKNRNWNCSDFEPAFMRSARTCATCSFARPSRTFVGAMVSTDESAYKAESLQQTLQRNKEIRDADAAAKAMELRQAFYSDGRVRSPAFLRTCGARMEDGRNLVVPAVNMRSDCEVHRPLLSVPQALLDAIRGELGAATDMAAFGYTVRLIRELAYTPLPKVLELIRAWLGDDARADAAARWAAFAIGERPTLAEWRASSGFPADLGVQYEPGAAGALMPAIIGCDAFDWAAAVSMSHDEKNSGPVRAAAAICQQAAEFTASMVSPVARRRGVDALKRLLAVPQLFSAATVEQVEPFLRALGLQAQMLDLASREELRLYLEELLGSISYLVASFLRADPMVVNISLSPGLQESLRLRVTDKQRLADRRATDLMRTLASVATRSGLDQQAERASYLKTLIEENAASLSDDFNVTQAAQDALSRQLGGAPDPGLAAFLAPMVQTQRRQQAAEAEALQLNPRKVSATLVLLRGAMPVTTCALQVMGATAKDEASPRNGAEAMRQPEALTLEALFSNKLDSASPRFADYLCRVRATPAPFTNVGSA